MRLGLAGVLAVAFVAAGVAGAVSRVVAPVPGAEFTDDYGGDFYVMSDASKIYYCDPDAVDEHCK